MEVLTEVFLLVFIVPDIAGEVTAVLLGVQENRHG